MALKETWQSYNETTKQYETSHPETEVSQVVGLAAAIEEGTKSAIDKEGSKTYAPKESPNFTGKVTADNVVVSTSLTIPGGKVWIE
nr:MAG TPA: hypothetical protein [Caudoviricetes sp.]